MDKDTNWYLNGFWIAWFLTFLGSWIYCVATYGFLLGVSLGWFPSAIVAFIVGALWPLVAFVAVLGLACMVNASI